MSTLARSLSSVPELGEVNLSMRNDKSAVHFRQRTNATLITELNRKIISWVQCLNRNPNCDLTVPKWQMELSSVR